MKIQEAKDLLSNLYKKSLFFSNLPIEEHPIRVLEASKSIIGINPDEPAENILMYCGEYVNLFQSSKENYNFEDFEFPSVVTYLDLELSLIDNDKEKSFRNLLNLLKVSEGTQILEFLLEFSLKYCSDTYFLIWSIYRMELFLGFVDIKKSLIICIKYILADKKCKEKRKFVENNMDNLLTSYIDDNMTYKDFIALYRMYNNNFVRKNKINPYILSVALEKYKFKKNERSMNILEDQKKYGRAWILDYTKNIPPNKISNNLILNLDAARGAIKILNNKKESEIIWNGLNRILCN